MERSIDQKWKRPSRENTMSTEEINVRDESRKGVRRKRTYTKI